MHCLLYLAFSNINFFNLRIEIISNDLCKAFLAAGIPFNKLQNPILRDVLESNLATEVFPNVNRLIAAMKLVFLKAPSRRTAYREGCPNLPLPPEPILTR